MAFLKFIPLMPGNNPAVHSYFKDLEKFIIGVLTNFYATNIIKLIFKSMQRKQIQSLSFFALFALMILLMGRVMLPFSSVLLWSAVFYILFNPVYSKILRRMDSSKKFYETKRHIVAALFAVGTVFVMVGVFAFLGFQLIGQGRLFLEEAKNFVAVNPLFFTENRAGTVIASTIKSISLGTIDITTLDIKSEMMRFLSTYSDTIITMTKDLLQDIGRFVLSLAFMCFSLYFFYADGAYLARLFISAIPIDQHKTKKLLSKFSDVTKNLFMGFFMVALYQAIMAFIIFAIFRIQGTLLFSVLILFSSFIPIFGCALVWFPLGLTVFVSRGAVSGVVFMLLCAVFISFLDNFIRPFFLRNRIKIHPLLIFFSILGGIQVFGLNGILLGPIIVILFFTIVGIALEEDLQHSDPDQVADLDEQAQTARQSTDPQSGEPPLSTDPSQRAEKIQTIESLLNQ